ncbi:MAG: hypothetical protein O7E54_07805, partial [Planctomycetota bacterium]|nr:hypothetical protein [Planctomycetota bacterium]
MDRAWVAVCLLCLLVLIPFGLLCACAFPNYDDFRIAASADSVGVIETVRSTYHSWSGRYFAYGSAAFLVRAGGLDGIYPLVPGLAFLGRRFAREQELGRVFEDRLEGRPRLPVGKARGRRVAAR